jgi:hypothetical protein
MALTLEPGTSKPEQNAAAAYSGNHITYGYAADPDFGCDLKRIHAEEEVG